MSMPRADAHIHLFDPGYAEILPESCRRVSPSEVVLYDELTRLHNIECALVVGYEGEPWAQGNNDYIARLSRRYEWIWPLAFIHDPLILDMETLEQYADHGFVGISLYLFGHGGTENPLLETAPEVWQWLSDHRWLVSVNSQGERWREWQPVLEQHPALRLLISHLGLPPRCAVPPDADTARKYLRPVLALQGADHVYVKLSGLYALTKPAYAFPHTACSPYVEALLESYGASRLLWGSDFSPALEWLSFPQTVHSLDAMPIADQSGYRAVYHDSLTGLLHAVIRREVSLTEEEERS